MTCRVLYLGIGCLIHVERWDRLVAAALELNRCGLDFRLRISW
jgi:hypothetical protein